MKMKDKKKNTHRKQEKDILKTENIKYNILILHNVLTISNQWRHLLPKLRSMNQKKMYLGKLKTGEVSTTPEKLQTPVGLLMDFDTTIM